MLYENGSMYEQLLKTKKISECNLYGINEMIAESVANVTAPWRIGPNTNVDQLFYNLIPD